MFPDQAFYLHGVNSTCQFANGLVWVNRPQHPLLGEVSICRQARPAAGPHPALWKMCSPKFKDFFFFKLAEAVCGGEAEHGYRMLFCWILWLLQLCRFQGKEGLPKNGRSTLRDPLLPGLRPQRGGCVFAALSRLVQGAPLMPRLLSSLFCAFCHGPPATWVSHSPENC